MEETPGNENKVVGMDNKPLNKQKHGSKQDVVSTPLEGSVAHRGQVDYQNCMLHSFSCYLEEAEAFNRHLTDLARHTAR